MIVNKSGTNTGFTVYSQDRTMAIYGFVLIFAAVVCAIGGKKGVYAILSLVFAFACIIGIMFPMMYRGNFTDRVDDHCSSVDNDRNIRTSWWIFEQNSVCESLEQRSES